GIVSIQRLRAFDESWNNRVYTDLSRSKLHCQGAAKTLKTRLRCGIVDVLFPTVMSARNRRSCNHRTTVSHARCGGTEKAKNTDEIDIEHVIETLISHVFQGSATQNTRHGYRNINTSRLIECGLCDFFNVS